MRKNIYTQAVNSIKAPESAVDKMLETAQNYSKKEKIIDMKKFRFKGVIAASLAAAIVLGGSFGISKLMPGTENSFVLTVDAAEITKTNSVVVNPETANGMAFSEGDDGEIGYALGMPVMCKGENIDTITYTVDRGDIEVAYHKDNNPVISGKESKKFLDCPGSFAFTKADQKKIKAYLKKEDKAHDNKRITNKSDDILDKLQKNYDSKHYSSITLKYDNQCPDGCTISLVGDTTALDSKARKYVESNVDKFFNLDDEYTLKQEAEVKDALAGGINIKCEVKFKDGESQTKNIVTGTSVGEFKDFFKDEYNKMPDDIKTAKNYKGVFVTYSIK